MKYLSIVLLSMIYINNYGKIDNGISKSLLNDKNIIIIGDSLNKPERWGDYFIEYSGCDCENYGNGSAGFVSKGITDPYEKMTFVDMLKLIISNKTIDEREKIEYIIVGGGINDALNNFSSNSIIAAVEKFITLERENFPNAKLVVIPIHTFKSLSKENMEKYQAIIDTAKNNDVITTDEFSMWTMDNASYNCGDDVHLTDLGYQVLASKILLYMNEVVSSKQIVNYELYILISIIIVLIIGLTIYLKRIKHNNF